MSQQGLHAPAAMLAWPIGPPASLLRRTSFGRSLPPADSCFCQSVFLAGATRNPGKLDMLIKKIQTLQWSDSNCDAVLLARMGRLAHVVQLHVA